MLEWKSVATAASVGAVVRDVRRYAEDVQQTRRVDGPAIPLTAVPFMGTIGQERCTEYGVAWLDLSGNARIVAPGLRILVEGKPNRFNRRRRPSTAFAPKGSRIARWLLMHPGEPVAQRELATAIGMDEGYTSRVTGRLLADGLIIRNEAGAVLPRDPDLVLDA